MMIWTNKRTVVATLVALCSVSGLATTQANSASVDLSITFEVAPASLLRARAISPGDVRSCESMELKVEALWANATKRPALDCLSPENAPLIVTSLSGPGLIARP